MPSILNNQALYREYMDQSRWWPSASAGEAVLIDAMHPAQAINSFHRLVAGMNDRDDIVNRLVYDCPLALALLEQAVGEKVSYTADIREYEVMHVPSPGPSLEECYDILKVMDHFEADATQAHERTHPISRARKLSDLIHLALTNQEIR